MDDDLIVQCIADRLDGLLDGADAERADRLIAERPDLHARALRMRALLYAPWSVEARPAPRARVVGPILRYAAAFAAGALLTFLLRGRPQEPPARTTVESAPEHGQPAQPVLLVENRRIT